MLVGSGRDFVLQDKEQEQEQLTNELVTALMKLESPAFANGVWGTKPGFCNKGEYLGICGEEAAAVLKFVTT